MKAQDYAKALYEAVAQTSPKDHDLVIDNFLKILSQNGDLSLMEEIEQEYERLESEGKGIKTVEVTTAKEYDQKGIVSELNRIVGDKIEVKNKVDEGLIGGVVVRVDDTLIDASVKNNLENLRKAIKG